ncbi:MULTISPECIES: DUF3515 domain-containing protein [Corynebacterium]|uniref:DUF3515 domain-containing protein n=1 Tax=Corynebacterium TaxID=1716 RepID=UPI0006615FE9|nr:MULTISPECIES: DUF3515 domain-containing protein [Corynebacterium]ASE55736.1 DUF3515 domain-containing protein [Corynebacterium jeikeium]KAA0883079.1 DUF3515 domain-containing protein [Corynebacterium amycolatum]KAA9225616.1 DUF3515 domain-containing protein [Corynebacterium amycolatum]MBC6792373.1 DUF3515 domain-containing protein [Corynebacterium sp. LK26]MDK6442164.1 DUF3515 domain-containing protein [Corynebacterium amycolatum]
MVDAPPSGETVQSKGSRTRAGIALAIAIISILGIIFAAKIYQDNQATKPVAISNPELPANDSPECAELLDRLPDRAAGLVRADIAEPAPEGAAVYRNLEQDRITLRCGANVPSQYNELAKTEEVKGISWLRVVDSTDESLATWFTVGREPVVAITAEGNAEAEDALSDLAEALRPDSAYKNKPERGGVPLVELAAPEADRRCSGLEAALPRELGNRHRLSTEEMPADMPKDMVIWGGTPADPVVLRCGVDEPAGYSTTTQQLTQVGDIVWFNEPTLSSGTSATWYAMGRERFVAVEMPMSEASSLMPVLSSVIADNLENISPSEEK